MAINKGYELQKKLSIKLVKFGLTALRIRPFYKTGTSTIGESILEVKILDSTSIGKRYQDIGRSSDVGLVNQANQDMTVFYAAGDADVQEQDVLSYLNYRHTVTRVHPFVLQDVIVYLEIATVRELQIGVQI